MPSSGFPEGRKGLPESAYFHRLYREIRRSEACSSGCRDCINGIMNLAFNGVVRMTTCTSCDGRRLFVAPSTIMNRILYSRMR